MLPTAKGAACAPTTAAAVSESEKLQVTAVEDRRELNLNKREQVRHVKQRR